MVEALDEDRELERVQSLNEAHVALMKPLFRFAVESRDSFYFSELVDKLQENPQLLGKLMQENLLFTDMLKLYEIGSIDVAAWPTWNETSKIWSSKAISTGSKFTKNSIKSPSAPG